MFQKIWVFSILLHVIGDILLLTFWSLVIDVYRVSQEERARLREGVPYVKVYRYNPKHLCSKL